MIYSKQALSDKAKEGDDLGSKRTERASRPLKATSDYYGKAN
ncbi:hypothetical protein [Limibacterium fermenti]